jgi:copper chaperone
MPTTNYTVPSIVCDGCVSLIDETLKVLPGVDTVATDKSTKVVVVEGSASPEIVKAAITAVGHIVAS